MSTECRHFISSVRRSQLADLKPKAILHLYFYYCACNYHCHGCWCNIKMRWRKQLNRPRVKTVSLLFTEKKTHRASCAIAPSYFFLVRDKLISSWLFYLPFGSARFVALHSTETTASQRINAVIKSCLSPTFLIVLFLRFFNMRRRHNKYFR